mmetsp:Transcript_15412/g.25464  ORF Transcript_15412/g.25464 Transcript_15412/m.25464 type:complete len:953 (+) Transcript_15412:273-3131(+)
MDGEEDFQRALTSEIDRISRFIRHEQYRILDVLDDFRLASGKQRTTSLEDVSKQLVRLERFHRLNSVGVRKILKKHDKYLPSGTQLLPFFADLHQLYAPDWNAALIALNDALLTSTGMAPTPPLSPPRFTSPPIQRMFSVKDARLFEVLCRLVTRVPIQRVLGVDRSPTAMTIYNAIYLDTDDFDLFRASLLPEQSAGISEARVRWFEDEHIQSARWTGDDRPHDVFLEGLSPTNISPVESIRVSAAEAGQCLQGRPISVLPGVSVPMSLPFGPSSNLHTLFQTRDLSPSLRVQSSTISFMDKSSGRLSMSWDIVFLCGRSAQTLRAEEWWRVSDLSQHSGASRWTDAVFTCEFVGQMPEFVRQMIADGLLVEKPFVSEYVVGLPKVFPADAAEIMKQTESQRRRATSSGSADGDGDGVVPIAVPSGAFLAPPTDSRSRKGSSGSSTPDPDEVALPHLMARGVLRGIDVIRMRARNLGVLTDNIITKSAEAMRLRAEDWWKRRPLIFFGGEPPKKKGPIEPKSFFANERTFLQYLKFCGVLLFLGGTLIGLQMPASPYRPTMPGSVFDTAPMAGYTFIAAAVLIAIWALFEFHLRAHFIRIQYEEDFSDRWGPVFLGLVMAGIMVLTLYYHAMQAEPKCAQFDSFMAGKAFGASGLTKHPQDSDSLLIVGAAGLAHLNMRSLAVRTFGKVQGFSDLTAVVPDQVSSTATGTDGKVFLLQSNNCESGDMAATQIVEMDPQTAKVGRTWSVVPAICGASTIAFQPSATSRNGGHFLIGAPLQNRPGVGLYTVDVPLVDDYLFSQGTQTILSYPSDTASSSVFPSDVARSRPWTIRKGTTPTTMVLADMPAPSYVANVTSVRTLRKAVGTIRGLQYVRSNHKLYAVIDSSLFSFSSETLAEERQWPLLLRDWRGLYVDDTGEGPENMYIASSMTGGISRMPFTAYNGPFICDRLF